MTGVVVSEAFAFRSTELDATPQGGVQVLIGKNQILAFCKSGDRGGTGQIPGGKHMTSFLTHEVSELFLESLMKNSAPISQPGSGGSRTPLFHGFNAGLFDFRVPGESEVVVA